MLKIILNFISEILISSRKRIADFCFAVSLSLVLSMAVSNTPTIIIETADKIVCRLENESGDSALAYSLAAFFLFIVCLLLDKFSRGDKK